MKIEKKNEELQERLEDEAKEKLDREKIEQNKRCR